MTCLFVMQSVLLVDAALQFHGSCFGRGHSCPALEEE